jgi:hypothetical protein
MTGGKEAHSDACGKELVRRHTEEIAAMRAEAATRRRNA